VEVADSAKRTSLHCYSSNSDGKKF
jgi:hypothetical protein